MLIDHIGYFFFPHLLILRIIGRLALPLFSFGIAEGYRATKDRTKVINNVEYQSKNIYLLRLTLFGLVSQIIYMVAFDTNQLNVILVFAISLFLLDKIDSKKYGYIFLILIILSFASLEGFVIAPIMILTFYYRDKIKNFNIILILFIQFLGIMITIALKGYSYYHLFFLISSLCILIVVKYKQKNNYPRVIPKSFFYLFYPAHLVLLWLIVP